MRHGMGVIGFFLVVLLVIAGCTSPQHTPTGSDSRNSATVSDITSGLDCQQYTKDLHRFKKFFPDLTGWQGIYDSNRDILYGSAGAVTSEMYIKSDNKANVLSISVRDISLCNRKSDYYTKYTVDERNWGAYYNQSEWQITVTQFPFHGYPATRVERINNDTGFAAVAYYIVLSPDTIVEMSAGSGLPNHPTTAQFEAEFEEFADAIDFNGIAASV
jgi:hypothetical protein